MANPDDSLASCPSWPELQNGSAFEFMRLPAELRRLIYHFYFCDTDSEGYLYNPDTGCLTHANGRPIDMDLRLTCGLVARETQHMALQSNTIIFRTGGPQIRQQYLPPENLWAGRGVEWEYNEATAIWIAPDRDDYFNNYPLGALVQHSKFI